MCELKRQLPKGDIYFLINTELKTEIVNCIEKAGEYYGVTTVALKDFEMESGHPNAEGMKTICKQVLGAIMKK